MYITLHNLAHLTRFDSQKGKSVFGRLMSSGTT